MSLQERLCAIRAGGCSEVGWAYVYRYGGRYLACINCDNAIKREERKDESGEIAPLGEGGEFQESCCKVKQVKGEEASNNGGRNVGTSCEVQVLPLLRSPRKEMQRTMVVRRSLKQSRLKRR